MPLEATMMVIDNSEYMRNGDYPPTRFDAQSDAVNVVFHTKSDSNPENSIGVMTMAGKGPEVLVTHTREIGQIIQGVHDAKAKLGGSVDLPTAINVATLALKHRQNKNLRQRILVFLGSPLDGPGVDEKSLVRLAKKLKKNNIAIDIVCYGDALEGDVMTVLRAFIENVNSGDNSHLVSAPPDPRRLLSESVVTSAVLAADRGDRDQAMADITNVAGGSGGADAFAEYGGVDPNLDPELAEVLRMSLEEERARQRALEQAEATASSSEPHPSVPALSTSTPAPVPQVPIGAGAVDSEVVDADEEAALQEALRISQQTEDVEMGDTATAAAQTAAAGTVHGDEEIDEDEEAAIARAIAMSMQPEGEQKK